MREDGFMTAEAHVGYVWSSALQCSTFLLRHTSGPFFGKNVDYPSKGVCHGLLLANPRGRRKEPLRFEGIPATCWESRYGSLTFTAFGKDFPLGGMNEAGLVIEPMTLAKTRYPPIGQAPRLQLGQWKQYILDSFASVRDVVENVSDAAPLGHTSHFLVADERRDCAAIEFLEGEPVCYTGEALPVPAVTNNAYAECVAFLGEHAGFGGSEPIPEEPGSLQNFVRIAHGLASDDARSCADPVGCGFAILDSVAQPDLTKRSTVYDIIRRQVHFRTVLGGPVRTVDMARLDFSPSAGTMMVGVGQDAEGDVTGCMSPLTREANVAAANSFSRMLLEVVSPDQPVALLPVTVGEMLEGVKTYAARVAL